MFVCLAEEECGSSYLESKLSIAFRTRLVDYLYTQYMRQQTYYRVDNLDGRLSNPDQCLTEDVAHFCSELAHIYSQISKPIFDIILMSAQLYMLARSKSGSSGQVGFCECQCSASRLFIDAFLVG